MPSSGSPDLPLAPDVTSRPVAGWLRWAFYAALAAGLVYGGTRLAFLCDDAYIHFRYAASAYEGRGLVWNPEPFARVEGAGFLWVLVLWAVWSTTGVPPPDSANTISLVCGLLQLMLLATAVARWRGRDGRVVPFAVAACTLVAIVGNRTFLQWLSGGLDTALSNTFIVWWALHAFVPPARRGRMWLMAWSLAAALAALTRPDGMPLVGATAAVVAWQCWRREVDLRRAVMGASPLLLVVGLTLWRHHYYGEWLPNTYFAKVVQAWPEAGWRYFACFALENGAWLWLPFLGLWPVVEACRRRGAVFGAMAANLPAVAAVGVVVFNACYYLFRVGGDHFEYRVLSPLVPLGTLACVATAGRLTGGARLPIAAALGLLLAGSAGWWHLAWTSEARAEGIKAITPQAPALLRPITRWFDRQQVWLFFRYIGLRCSHHAARLETLRVRFPERVHFPAAMAGDGFPIRAESAVGLPGWCLPDVALIDVFGLNDWVVARTPTSMRQSKGEAEVRAIVTRCDADHDGFLGDGELRDALQAVVGVRPEGPYAEFFLGLFWQFSEAEVTKRVTLEQAVEIVQINDAPRRMAHEKSPPPGYVEAFEPNVDVDDQGRVTVKPRATPMTAERIRAIEAEWKQKVLTGQLPR